MLQGKCSVETELQERIQIWQSVLTWTRTYTVKYDGCHKSDVLKYILDLIFFFYSPLKEQVKKYQNYEFFFHLFAFSFPSSFPAFPNVKSRNLCKNPETSPACCDFRTGPQDFCSSASVAQGTHQTCCEHNAWRVIICWFPGESWTLGPWPFVPDFWASWRQF